MMIPQYPRAPVIVIFRDVQWSKFTQHIPKFCIGTHGPTAIWVGPANPNSGLGGEGGIFFF